MWKRFIITMFLLMLFLLVMMYGINYSLSRWEQKILGKKTEEPSPLQSIQSTIKSWTPIITTWSITASVLIAAIMIAYRSYVARTRLLSVIKPRDFIKHVLVFGPTGSGKTSTSMKAIELALKNGSEAVIIDWKGEYASYFNGATITRKTELLKPDTDYEVYSLIIVDMLRDILELSEPMAYMLYDELMKGYKVYGDLLTFSKLIKSLEVRRASAIASRSYAEANIAEALIRRLYLLAIDEGRSVVNIHGSRRVVIYDLSDIPTYQLKCLYAEIILWRLYNSMKSSRSPAKKPKLEKLLVAEESQNYVRPRRAERAPSIGERVINELRAYGCGVLMICPDPMQTPLHMVHDCGAIVSIGYQALPEVISELLSFYRYADIKKLIKTTGRTRTYIYYNGKLHVKGVPKPFRKTIDLGVQTKEEVITIATITKAEEEGPSGGAFTPSLMAGDWGEGLAGPVRP
jgi:hypothetical protein